MDLFPCDPLANLLPHDGSVHYHGAILSAAQSQVAYDCLFHQIPWQHDEAVIFGKRLITARKVAWYGDQDFSYTYSGTTKQALTWTPELAALKATVEQHTGTIFNSCLLNLYHNGDEGMGWHSDDEKSLGKDSTIASVSLGAAREFRFKHKRTAEKVSILLTSGSLLVMQGTTQSHWLHTLPKSKKVLHPRINLTFRTMVV
jgi:alkylated DNA repair dioxygenase AlkB